MFFFSWSNLDHLMFFFTILGWPKMRLVIVPRVARPAHLLTRGVIDFHQVWPGYHNRFVIAKTYQRLRLYKQSVCLCAFFAVCYTLIGIIFITLALLCLTPGGLALPWRAWIWRTGGCPCSTEMERALWPHTSSSNKSPLTWDTHQLIFLSEQK